MAYIGWEIPEYERQRLLMYFQPLYPDIIAHHITENAGVPKDAIATPAYRAEIIGYANDGNGVEALIVSVNGSHIRKDGKVFHITMSIDRAKGRKPVHSNDVIKNGYTPIHPFMIDVFPKTFI